MKRAYAYYGPGLVIIKQYVTSKKFYFCIHTYGPLYSANRQAYICISGFLANTLYDTPCELHSLRRRSLTLSQLAIAYILDGISHTPCRSWRLRSRLQPYLHTTNTYFHKIYTSVISRW